MGTIAEDCEDNNDAILTVAGCTATTEICDSVDNDCDGLIDELSDGAGFYNPADRHEFCWEPLDEADAYEVVRSDNRDHSGVCTRHTTSGTCWSDAESPSAEMAFFYLCRAISPFIGSWGRDSSGVERTSICP